MLEVKKYELCLVIKSTNPYRLRIKCCLKRIQKYWIKIKINRRIKKMGWLRSDKIKSETNQTYWRNLTFNLK